MKSRNVLNIIIGIVFSLLIVTFTLIGMYDTKGKTQIISSAQDIKTGLDISGGISAVYKPDIEGNVSDEDMAKAKNIIRKRLDNKNLFDANVKVDLNNGWVEVEIPDETNPDEALSNLGQTAKLEFRDPDGNVIVDGSNIISAKEQQIQSEMGTYQEVVSLNFNEEGRQKFSQATENLVGRSISIYLDDALISAPVVNEPITTGNAVISMGSSDLTEAKKEATELASLIDSGALPFGLSVVSSQYIGPTVGSKALDISIKAALIGTILVMIYMICIYKLPGVVSSISLVTYIGIVLLLLSNMGITLTLPGIAGIILSIGMAVDANIVIFERIKEELMLGKSIQKSVNLGFKNATSSIVDANITTAIAAVALYVFGIGTVKGFGIVLLIGVIISMITAIFFTRFMLKNFSAIFNKNVKLYGGKANG